MIAVKNNINMAEVFINFLAIASVHIDSKSFQIYPIWADFAKKGETTSDERPSTAWIIRPLLIARPKQQLWPK
jgi:hypothetical protein